MDRSLDWSPGFFYFITFKVFILFYFSHWGILFAHMYYTYRRRTPGFALLCVFVFSSWSIMPAEVGSTVKRNWRLFFHFARSLSCTSNLDWSLHTYLTCPCGLRQFSQLCDQWWSQIHQCNRASSSQLETGRWLWSTA